MRNVQVRQRLVTADIHGTDNAQLAVAGLNSLLVALELHFLGRDILPAHKHKLGAEQAYPPVAVLGSVGGIIRAADVGSQLNLHAILGNSRQIPQGSIAGLSLFLLLQLLHVLQQGSRIRINNNQALVAVQNHLGTLRNLIRLMLDAHNCRNRPGLGNDNCMAGGTALPHNNAGNLVIRHTGNYGWLYLIAAKHNHILAHLRLLDAQNLAGDALAHIQHIGCTLAQVFVIHGLENCRRLSSGCQYSSRGIAHLLNLGSHAVSKHRILCQEHVSFHDVCLLIMTGSPHLLHALFQNICNLSNSCIQLFQFFLHRSRLVRCQMAIQCLTGFHDFTNGNAWNCSHSLQFFWHN